MRVPLLLLLLVCTPVVAQQQFGAGGPGGAPQPLHDVLMMVFDKDHDGKVTMGEVTQTMGSLEALLSEGGDPASGENPYLGMLQGAQAAAPHLFTLLDADASEGLTKAELKWVTKFQKALKSGAARNLTRDVFNAVDVDPTDDKLSAAEVAALADAASPVLAAVADLVHAAFPLRRSADDLDLEAQTASFADGEVHFRIQSFRKYKCSRNHAAKKVETVTRNAASLLVVRVGKVGIRKSTKRVDILLVTAAERSQCDVTFTNFPEESFDGVSSFLVYHLEVHRLSEVPEHMSQHGDVPWVWVVHTT